VSHLGRTSAAPLPSFGAIAPKIQVEVVRWSFGAQGREPRFAQRRVILFFWTMRASSANRISKLSASTPFSRTISSSQIPAQDLARWRTLRLGRLDDLMTATCRRSD
jgi:hypothetical protein